MTNTAGKILSHHGIRDRTGCAHLSRDVSLGRAQLSQPITLGFKSTLLKPLRIKSTLVPFRNKRQLKDLSVSEDKNELSGSKLQENIFLPIESLFVAQEVWMFSGNVDNNCSNLPIWCNLHQHTLEHVLVFCCFISVANSQGFSQGKHFQISCIWERTCCLILLQKGIWMS